MMSRGLVILETRRVGNGQKHLKFMFSQRNSENKMLEGIFFKGEPRAGHFRAGECVCVAYHLRSSQWNGNHRIELHILDIKEGDNI